MKEFLITIDKFDGPLDLMLHLIHEKQLDLMHLDLKELTDQYIHYIHSMQALHLEIAGEYLAQLAKLIEYKSKQLLPQKNDEIEDDYQADLKDNLMQRLLEYQSFKEIKNELSAYYDERQLKYSRPRSELSLSAENTSPLCSYNGNPYDLFKAMNRLWQRQQLISPKSVSYTVKEISLEDRLLELRSRFISLPDFFSFTELLSDCDTKSKLVVTFLALLDLARQQKIWLEIDQKDEIWIKKGKGENGY